MKKRILSFVLCLILIATVSTTAIPVMAATTMTMTALSQSGAAAKANDVVTIASPDELDAFAKYVDNSKNTDGVTFKLLNDIVYNTGDASDYAETTGLRTYATAGDYNKPFKGIFEGNNKTISGLYINSTDRYVGLIGSLGGATVQNLSIVNSYIYTAKTGASAIAGAVNAGTNIISNVYVDAIIEACVDAGQNHGYVGGIVGLLSGAISLSISNVTVEGSYTSGKASVGGVVGRIQSVPFEIENCISRANVTGTQCVGGIVGYEKTTTSSYTNVYVNATITSTDTTNTYAYIGGVVGQTESTSKLSISDAVVEGIITATKGSVGGVVGEITNTSVVVNITRAVNHAPVTGSTAVGGIVGYSKTSNITVNNCITGGYMTAKKGWSGYIVGRNDADNGCTVNNCAYVTDNIDFSDNNGGAVGKKPVDNSCCTTVDDITKVAAAVTWDDEKWTERYSESIIIPTTVANMIKNAPGGVMAQASTKDADGKYSVRFLVPVDTLDYDAAALYITATTSSGTTKKYFVNVTTAYTSVIAHGEPAYASDHGGKYFLAHAIVGVDEPGENITWTVQVITVSNDVKNETQAFTFTGVSANETEVK